MRCDLAQCTSVSVASGLGVGQPITDCNQAPTSTVDAMGDRKLEGPARKHGERSMEQLPNRKPLWRSQAVKPQTVPSIGGPVADRWQQITRGTKTLMLTRVADATAAGSIVTASTPDDPHGAVPLELSHRILPSGEAVAKIGGELDIATAEMAVRYVKRVIDGHRGPVIAQLTAVRFCDARGLSALVRMARYAERAGRPFRLASPSPPVVKIMRITGLDRGVPGLTAAARIPSELSAGGSGQSARSSRSHSPAEERAAG